MSITTIVLVVFVVFAFGIGFLVVYAAYDKARKIEHRAGSYVGTQSRAGEGNFID